MLISKFVVRWCHLDGREQKLIFLLHQEFIGFLRCSIMEVLHKKSFNIHAVINFAIWLVTGQGNE